MKTKNAFFKVALNYFSVFTIVSVYAPYLQVYLRKSGNGINEVGYILAVSMASAVAGPLSFGALAKKGIPLKLLVSIICIAIVAVFFTIRFVSGFAMTAMLFGLLGLCYSALIPFTETIANATLDDPERQYGRARFFGTVGFLVPTLVFSIIGFPGRYPAAYILYAGIGATLFHLSTVRAYPVFKQTQPSHIQKEGSLGTVFWLIVFITFLNRFAMTAHYSFFSLYLDEALGIDSIGWFWLVGPMMETPVLFFGGWLLARYSIPALLAVSGLAIALRLSVYALFPSAPAVFAVQFLHCGTFGVFYIAVIAAIRRSVSRHNLTVAMAIFAALGMGLGPIAGSSLGGFVIEHFGYAALYLFSASVALASSGVAIAYRRLLISHTIVKS